MTDSPLEGTVSFEFFKSRSMKYKRIIENRFVFQNDQEGYIAMRNGDSYEILGHWVYE